MTAPLPATGSISLALSVAVATALGLGAAVATATERASGDADTSTRLRQDTGSALVQLNGDPLASYVKTKPAKGKKIDFSSNTVKSYRAQL